MSKRRAVAYDLTLVAAIAPSGKLVEGTYLGRVHLRVCLFLLLTAVLDQVDRKVLDLLPEIEALERQGQSDTPGAP